MTDDVDASTRKRLTAWLQSWNALVVVVAALGGVGLSWAGHLATAFMWPASVETRLVIVYDPDKGNDALAQAGRQRDLRIEALEAADRDRSRAIDGNVTAIRQLANGQTELRIVVERIDERTLRILRR